MRGLTDEQNVTVDEAENILRKDYRSDVVGIVSAYADALGDDITDSEDADTWIHETIDGSQRVMYTYQAQQCLLYSDNDGAYGEDFGGDGMVEDGCIMWSRLAFCAFRADVLEDLELYGLPYGDFDDVDIEVLEAETKAEEMTEHFETMEALLSEMKMDVAVFVGSREFIIEDFENFDETEERKKVLEAIGEKVNAELKKNGWFD